MFTTLVASGFRRRLTGAFILVAAATSGLLAVTSYLLLRNYRHEAFVSSAKEQARLSLLSVQGQLSLGDFESLLEEYRQRGGFQTVAIAGDVVFSSLPELGRDDIPPDLEGPLTPGQLAEARAEVAGERYLVLGGTPGGSDEEFYFFFPMGDLLRSIRDFGNVLVVGWVVAMAVASVFGRFVVRQTLKPIRAVADASRALAEGLLDTRLPPLAGDEVGTLASAFNEMADALQATIEQLRSAAERERRFTADVAHELRTPLAGMVSAASLVEEELGRLPQSTRRPVELLVNDVRRLRRLVLELLELSRLDAGREEVDLRPVDLHRALGRALHGIGDEVAIRVPPDLHIVADEARFCRVMANLVRNAFRHGAPPVSVEARQAGDEVIIDVRDAGPGIAEEDVPGIFTRFYKADRSRSSAGAGLGLAIAMENARLQGGWLSAANQAGGGACFTFVLHAAPESGGDEDASVELRGGPEERARGS